MRFIWQPQPQVVLCGSCRTSRRGRPAGSGWRSACWRSCGAAITHALPRQTQHQGIELCARQCRRVGALARPGESALVQSACCQPHADAVMHQHLHASGSLVRIQVRMVRARCAEHLHHAGQGSRCRRACPPARRPAPRHRCGLPQQLAQPDRALARCTGAQADFHCRGASLELDAEFRRRLFGCYSRESQRDDALPTAVFDVSASDVGLGGAARPHTQRRRRLALMPRAMATAAIKTPGCRQAANACVLNSSLCRRRRRSACVNFAGMHVSTYSLMDTMLLYQADRDQDGIAARLHYKLREREIDRTEDVGGLPGPPRGTTWQVPRQEGGPDAVLNYLNGDDLHQSHLRE